MSLAKRIVITGLITCAFCVIGVLILSARSVETELTIDARADSLSFEQFKDLSWFGDSIKSSRLILEGTKIMFVTSSVNIKKDGNQYFQSADKEKHLEINPLNNNKSGYLVQIYKAKLDSSDIPAENIELNAIDVSKSSKVFLRMKRNPVTIEIGIESGNMEGRINAETFHLVVREGEVRSGDKTILCSGNFEITGKLVPAFAELKFETKSNGRVILVKPQPNEKDIFFNGGHKKEAINTINVEISSKINSISTRDSYIRYFPINGYAREKSRKISPGKQISISSKRNFDINVLNLSLPGIHFVSETRSKDIFVDTHPIAPSLLESVPPHWLYIGAIIIFFIDKILLGVVLRKVEEKE